MPPPAVKFSVVMKNWILYWKAVTRLPGIVFMSAVIPVKAVWDQAGLCRLMSVLKSLTPAALSGMHRCITMICPAAVCRWGNWRLGRMRSMWMKDSGSIAACKIFFCWSRIPVIISCLKLTRSATAGYALHSHMIVTETPCFTATVRKGNSAPFRITAG